MAKTKKNPQKEKKIKPDKKQSDAWISMRTGLITVTVVSLGMAGLTGWMTIPALGWLEGLLWSLGFGIAVWVVFAGFFYFNQYVRGKRD